MQRIVDLSKGDIGEEHDENEVLDISGSSPKRKANTFDRLKRRATNIVMGMQLPEETDKSHEAAYGDGNEMYHLPSAADEASVSKMQLQRLLDED